MIYIKYGRVVIHTSEPRITKTALGSRFDDNGEVLREQKPIHVNGRTRATADSDDDTDLEPEVVLDKQDAPSADHETGEQAVGDVQGDPRENGDSNIKASVQIQSVVYQGQP